MFCDIGIQAGALEMIGDRIEHREAVRTDSRILLLTASHLLQHCRASKEPEPTSKWLRQK